MKTRIAGIVMIAVGVAIVLVALIHATTTNGEMYSWSFPFSDYEAGTMAIGVIGFHFLVLGVATLLNRSVGGIISSATGVALALFTFVRITSLYGRMHTWSPPFTGYELATIATGIVGFVLLTLGVVVIAIHSKTTLAASGRIMRGE